MRLETDSNQTEKKKKSIKQQCLSTIYFSSSQEVSQTDRKARTEADRQITITVCSVCFSLCCISQA